VVHTEILFLYLQHTAAHRWTSLPLQKLGPPVSSFPLMWLCPCKTKVLRTRQPASTHSCRRRYSTSPRRLHGPQPAAASRADARGAAAAVLRLWLHSCKTARGISLLRAAARGRTRAGPYSVVRAGKETPVLGRDYLRRPAPPPPHKSGGGAGMGEGGRRADLLAAPSSPREITTSSCGAPGGVAVEEDEAGGLRSDGGAGALRTDGGERRASSSGRKRPEATRRPERERADMWAHFCKCK
jgi:hypothetical protein